MPETVKAKGRRRGYTRVSRKNQVTIPVDVLGAAGIGPGDELKVEAAGRGRVVLVRPQSLIEKYAGSLPSVFPPGYLGELRSEWER